MLLYALLAVLVALLLLRVLSDWAKGSDRDADAPWDSGRHSVHQSAEHSTHDHLPDSDHHDVDVHD